MSFASVCIITACLIIMGSFSLLAINVNSIIGEFENENVILAYVADTLSEEEARALKDRLEAVPNVTSAFFTSREEAMRKFIGNYEDESRFKDLLSSDFRHRFSVYVDDISLMEQTRNAIRDAVPGIDNVNANLIIARGFVTIRNIVSGVSVVLVAILLVVSLFIMSNTIKLGTFERREEIAIMKMVGATNAFIRWPFIFEGFILGMIGSLIAFVAQWGIYAAITGRIMGSQSIGFITTIPYSRAAVPLFVVFIAIGFGVGVVGSVMAIRKYMKV
jgi:cell division transport system permease protein